MFLKKKKKMGDEFLVKIEIKRQMSLEYMMTAQVFTTVMSMLYSYNKQTKQQQTNKQK